MDRRCIFRHYDDRHIRYDGISDSVDDKGYKGVVDMNKEKQIEEMADIVSKCITRWLNNETTKSSPNYIAETLYTKDYRKASEIAREIFEEIEKELARYAHLHRYAEEAREVTEEYADGSPVEMTSVWDACRLEHNGYDDYETMCKLQDNIGYIEKSRLLKEFEGDIANLKKKYTKEERGEIWLL